MGDEQKWPKASYRYGLRALISLRGFRSVSEFARRLEVPTSQIGRVVGGWEFPTESFAKRIAAALEIDLSALEELLRPTDCASSGICHKPVEFIEHPLQQLATRGDKA